MGHNLGIESQRAAPCKLKAQGTRLPMQAAKEPMPLMGYPSEGTERGYGAEFAGGWGGQFNHAREGPVRTSFTFIQVHIP